MAITSDILPYQGVDMSFDAMQMPFESGQVAAFVMIDVLHHIKNSRAFFTEMDRTLAPGGKVVMIEPAYTPLSGVVYKNFHHEPFDPKGWWGFEEGGPLSGANDAIPWIIFHRDRQQFEQEFPQFQIVRLSLHTPLMYLLSGGLSVRQLAPDWCYGWLRGVEKLMKPLYPLCALFMTIELQKKA